MRPCCTLPPLWSCCWARTHGYARCLNAQCVWCTEIGRSVVKTSLAFFPEHNNTPHFPPFASPAPHPPVSAAASLAAWTSTTLYVWTGTDSAWPWTTVQGPSWPTSPNGRQTGGTPRINCGSPATTIRVSTSGHSAYSSFAFSPRLLPYTSALKPAASSAGGQRRSQRCRLRLKPRPPSPPPPSNTDGRNGALLIMLLHIFRYKYVVHVDGLGWSDKIFTLMMTGSCILLEQSGYRSFFGRQLRPFVHYVPFWKTRPQARERSADRGRGDPPAAAARAACFRLGASASWAAASRVGF